MDNKNVRDSKAENSNVVRDRTYNRPVERANHRYPTRNVIQEVQQERKSDEIQQSKNMKPDIKTPHVGQYEQDNVSNIPLYLINAVIDDEEGEVDIMALVHGIEVLEKQVNAITCPETGK